jgi:hypothetical protein
MGYRKIENDTEIPLDYSVLKEKEDPYPVLVFGLSKPLSSNKISNYLTPGFYYYVDIYRNIQSFGLPLNGTWLDNPKWVLTLVHFFDDINEEYTKYKKVKGYI